jgi:dihydroorotate dehydrogenase electron transfer subunit
MVKYRSVEYAKKFPRVFFTCFSEIRKRAEEVDKEAYLQVFALPLMSENGVEDYSPKVATIKAEVIDNIPVGEGNTNHYKLKFRAPNLHNIIPGQFIMIKTQPLPKENHPIEAPIMKLWSELNLSNCSDLRMKPLSYLKRPFGIHRAFYKNFGRDYLKKIYFPKTLSSISHTIFPDEFDIFYKVIKNGVGTTELAELKKNAQIEIMGPLGKRFNLRELPSLDLEEIHVIGGGVGMAPLVFMVQALRFFNFKVKAFIGIVRYDFLKHKDDYAGSYHEDPENAYIYIDDLLDAGLSEDDIYISCDQDTKTNESKIRNCQIGFISDYYEQYLNERNFGNEQVVKVRAITCGPTAMMKAIYQITDRFKIPLKVLMEKRMACGIGVCLSCVCHAKTENGEKQYLRVCKEGPLFDAEEIDWNNERS